MSITETFQNYEGSDDSSPWGNHNRVEVADRHLNEENTLFEAHGQVSLGVRVVVYDRNIVSRELPNCRPVL